MKAIEIIIKEGERRLAEWFDACEDRIKLISDQARHIVKETKDEVEKVKLIYEDATHTDWLQKALLVSTETMRFNDVCFEDYTPQLVIRFAGVDIVEKRLFGLKDKDLKMIIIFLEDEHEKRNSEKH